MSRPMRPSCNAALFALVLSVCGVASAQQGDHDKARLIDALAEENMPELFERLVETEPPADAVEAKLVEVARYRLRFADAALTDAQRQAAFEGALRAMRELIAQHRDHPMRPMWQTDLAGMLLDDYLGVVHRAADLFCEFGVPTDQQRAAFAAAATEAYELSSDAGRRLFQLRTESRRVPEVGQYDQRLTPFYLARAGYLSTLVPGDDPEFKRLNTDATELRAEALNALQNVGAKLDDDSAAADAVAALSGRIYLRRGELRAAEEALEQVGSRDPLTDLTAQLARLSITAQRSGAAAAITDLHRLRSHPLVQSRLLYRLLLVDFEHRLLLDNGSAAAAYRPYFELLDDPALGDEGPALRAYVYRRWAHTVPPQQVNSLPPAARVAIGQTLRAEGHRALVAAQESGDPAAQAAAAAVLERSMRVHGSLLEDDVPDDARAAAMYELAMGLYLTSTDDLGGLLEAADLLTDAAERYPAQPIAERAISDAATLLRSLHAAAPRPPGVDAAYRRAIGVLLDKYRRTAAADDQRVYYAYNVLQRGGDYRGAIELYRGVPRSHPSYLAAQRELLFALEHLMLQAEGEQQRAAAEELREAAERVQRAAHGDGSFAAREALGAARIVQAELAHRRGDLNEALAMLEGFADEFAEHDDLAPIALERQIVMLAEAHRAEQLTEAARRMMRDFPDDAAAVVDAVLTRLDRQIEQQRAIVQSPGATDAARERASSRIDTLAQTAEGLADILSRWAAAQGFNQQQMAPYEMIRLKVLLLAGEAQRAVEVAGPLVAAFPDDLGVLRSAADAYFAAGDEGSLVTAAHLYDRIIRGLGAPYPEAYWHAWVRRLQINDRLGEFTDEIPRTVRQLQMQDATLGGPRYSNELQRLAEKYEQGD